jgi:DNA-binding LacI/PurR family transcriptional regulator
MAVNKVGLLMSSKSDAYSYRLMQSISNVASEMDLTIVPSWVDDYGHSATTELARFEEMGCLAVVIPWFPPASIYDVAKLVESSDFPFSHPQLYPGFGSASTLSKAPQSALTLRQITESICQYMLQVGATKLAFIGPKDPENGFLENKVGAFAFYCATRDIPSTCHLVDADVESMDRLAEQLAEDRSSWGIISYDDEHALRFMTSMHKLGKSAPLDYRIIGNNDTEGSRYSDPPLTTVVQNFEFIAQRLLRGALAVALRAPVQQGEIEYLPLVVRESCGGAEIVAAGQIKIPRLIPRLSSKLSERFRKLEKQSIPVA